MNGVDKLDKEALVLLNGHEKEVYACSWNPVKNILVSGSSDSTARVWSLPNKVEDSKAVVPKVLNHGTGPHKDVTTLEWNVRAILVFLRRPSWPLCHDPIELTYVLWSTIYCSTMDRCWHRERTMARRGSGTLRAR